jgi:hypothetical protein
LDVGLLRLRKLVAELIDLVVEVWRIVIGR